MDDTAKTINISTIKYNRKPGNDSQNEGDISKFNDV